MYSFSSHPPLGPTPQSSFKRGFKTTKWFILFSNFINCVSHSTKMFSSGPNYNKLKTNLRLSVNRLKLLEKKKTETNQKARKEIAGKVQIPEVPLYNVSSFIISIRFPGHQQARSRKDPRGVNYSRGCKLDFDKMTHPMINHFHDLSVPCWSDGDFRNVLRFDIGSIRTGDAAKGAWRRNSRSCQLHHLGCAEASSGCGWVESSLGHADVEIRKAVCRCESSCCSSVSCVWQAAA